MNNFAADAGHTFQIPVMGTGFTIDSPAKVARFGISSVISLVDDVLIEQIREYYCKKEDEPYEEIKASDPSHRAHRISEYLNLLDRIIKQQVEKMRQEPFFSGGDLDKYFELLPDTSSLKNLYNGLKNCNDKSRREEIETTLRENVIPGSIDCNIMTKLNSPSGKQGFEETYAATALRGFGESVVDASLIFSAGISREMFSYLEKFKDFFADTAGQIKKRIVLKVSDYRSALLQGKMLAKKGLWVSEYRIESGLNCGGHAFATKGELMGPILQEFKNRRDDLVEQLGSIYLTSIKKLGIDTPQQIPRLEVTIQGGIGTPEEDRMLRSYYKANKTGWGTPFMLVPEATTIDDEHLHLLAEADEDTVFLSDASPLGVKFWNLKNSSSENQRRRRIEEGKPGSKCTKRFCTFNSDYTDNPVCTASAAYLKKHLAAIEASDASEKEKAYKRKYALSRSCICDELGGGALLEYGIREKSGVAVCCGSNIVNFSKIVTLREMIDHIYGRSLLPMKEGRPHMFIQELRLYIDFLKEEVEKANIGVCEWTETFFESFRENMIKSISYYRDVAPNVAEHELETFQKNLDESETEVRALRFPNP